MRGQVHHGSSSFSSFLIVREVKLRDHRHPQAPPRAMAVGGGKDLVQEKTWWCCRGGFTRTRRMISFNTSAAHPVQIPPSRLTHIQIRKKNTETNTTDADHGRKGSGSLLLCRAKGRKATPVPTLAARRTSHHGQGSGFRTRLRRHGRGVSALRGLQRGVQGLDFARGGTVGASVEKFWLPRCHRSIG